MNYKSNEELLREGECTAFNCVEPAVKGNLCKLHRCGHGYGTQATCPCYLAGETGPVANTQLLREALEALRPAADLLRTRATEHHDSLEPVQELRVLKVLNPARTAITKLEERLLRE